MEKYLIESRVSEVRMHTIVINGAPCVLVVYPNGTIELNVQTAKSAEPKVKAVKQHKPSPAAKSKPEPIRPLFKLDPAVSDAGLAAKFAGFGKKILNHPMRHPDTW